MGVPVPILLLACPLVAALWVVVFGSRPNLREFGTLAAALVMATFGVELALRASNVHVQTLRKENAVVANCRHEKRT